VLGKTVKMGFRSSENEQKIVIFGGRKFFLNVYKTKLTRRALIRIATSWSSKSVPTQGFPALLGRGFAQNLSSYELPNIIQINSK